MIYKSVKDVDDKSLIKKELYELLLLLEKVNPCEQRYMIHNNGLVVSYKLDLNLLTFSRRFSLKIKSTIVGLPISIGEKSYFGHIDDVKEILKGIKGLTIILNAGNDLACRGQTLSSYVFENRYEDFNRYIDSLRSPYKRRIKKALSKRDKLVIRNISNNQFTKDHYDLYRSVMSRTENPLEILSIDYFRGYDADVVDFFDSKSNRILGFVQLKQIADIYYFLFCGFNREDNEEYDLYFNMLLTIIKMGIEKGVRTINFGQTSEESKSKIGCIQEPKYLCIYHSNRVLNFILQKLLPVFSYKPYNVVHRVFKDGFNNEYTS